MKSKFLNIAFILALILFLFGCNSKAYDIGYWIKIEDSYQCVTATVKNGKIGNIIMIGEDGISFNAVFDQTENIENILKVAFADGSSDLIDNISAVVAVAEVVNGSSGMEEFCDTTKKYYFPINKEDGL